MRVCNPTVTFSWVAASSVTCLVYPSVHHLCMPCTKSLYLPLTTDFEFLALRCTFTDVFYNHAVKRAPLHPRVVHTFPHTVTFNVPTLHCTSTLHHTPSEQSIPVTRSRPATLCDSHPPTPQLFTLADSHPPIHSSPVCKPPLHLLFYNFIQSQPSSTCTQKPSNSHNRSSHTNYQRHARTHIPNFHIFAYHNS